jgi:hypothetical protein
MTKPPRDLTDFVELVAYELSELVLDAAWIVGWPAGIVADTTLKNAMLESELVHARCLIEFLLNKSGSQNVRALDFRQGWVPANEAALSTLYSDICGHLSHLGKNRVGVKRDWYPEVIVNEIVTALEDLTSRLGPAPHVAKFKQYIVGARAIHQNRIAPNVMKSFTTNDTVLVIGDFRLTGSTGPPPLPPS